VLGCLKLLVGADLDGACFFDRRFFNRKFGTENYFLKEAFTLVRSGLGCRGCVFGKGRRFLRLIG
jgi:hypothetical protein